MRIPSVKTLKRIAGITPEKAKEVRALLEYKRDPDDYGSVQDWVRKCHNRPAYAERLMRAIDEVIEGFGIEVIRAKDEEDDSFEYVNLGDTYCTTIMRNRTSGRIFVCDMGTIVERGDFE